MKEFNVTLTAKEAQHIFTSLGKSAEVYSDQANDWGNKRSEQRWTEVEQLITRLRVAQSDAIDAGNV
jgi:hypothetical protein